MEISKRLDKKILTFLQKNPLELDFDYRDEFSIDQLKTILGSEDGLNQVEDEIYTNSLDWIFDSEKYFITETLFEEFEDELLKQKCFKEYEDYAIEQVIKDYLIDNYRENVNSYLKFDQLFNNTRDLFVLLKVYSNYDCTNSFDTLETSEYLSQVYSRIKSGVKKEDFVWEHINGAYGGSLFCFAFKTDIKTLINYKRLIKESKTITIPKGTQFGFFSSFQGSGSPFEKTTYRTMTINIQEEGEDFCEYDHVDFVADIEQHYSMEEVYGPTSSFLDEQTLIIK